MKTAARLAAMALLGGTLAAGGCRLSGPSEAKPLGLEEGTEPAPCKTTADCPGTGNPCVVGVCVDGLCRAKPVPKDVALAQQTPGDCRKLVCDGRGYAGTRADDRDLPPDDENACTKEACGGGTPQSDWVDVGAACGDHGVCNGAGVCGVCIPGKKRCAGNGVAACGANGQWGGAAQCPPATPACGGEACVAVAEVAAGEAHTCARLADGTVRCWGRSWAHQLGDVAPARIPGLAGVAEIAVGGGHACARIGDGTAMCWGANRYGELGDGTTEARPAPVAVAGVASVAQIALGGGHSCARLTDGSVRCWGRNDEGQLGDGSTNRGPPQKESDIGSLVQAPKLGMVTPAIGGVAQLALGSSQSCARLTDGGVACWGGAPTVGPAEAPPRPKPTAVRGLKTAAEIAAGDRHTCARLVDGTVKCWGANSSGQLGDGTTAGKTAPTAVKGLKDVVAIAAGASHTCARLAAGTVVCWGRNDAGQLGDGTSESRKVPVPLTGLPGAGRLALGGAHGCGQVAGGAVQCWGRNGEGELGDGSTSNRNTPTFVRW